MSLFSAIFVCARDGSLMRIQRANGTWVGARQLEDAGAQCVAISQRRVLVGTHDRGVLFSADAGESWEQADLPERSVFSVAISDADGALYAGTEPSRLFVSRDAQHWSELEALQRIPSRDRWSFPPRPWTHHVRWIAPDPRHQERLLVGIELGGLMYSDDAGETFSDHRPGAKRDVHNVVWHPRVQGRVYEAAGDGAAFSRDGGLTWEAADGGRDLPYCWALAVDASDPESWYVSAASGPGTAHRGTDARGALYRWSGKAWKQLALPDDTMPYALVASDAELIAGMADGRIIHSGDRGQSWTDTGVQAGPVVALAAD
ncbi:MAG TPA: sialidase family protein [Solirubrobacteraceae bacterium]|nr:sialidase family protein [Solirubrobacteraceae bacterium]